MTSVFSLFFSLSIYLIYQLFKYNSAEEECKTSAKKSNVCSKLIYLFGVVLFVYRFKRQPWRHTIQPLRLVFDALTVLLAIEFLYSFLWLRVEFFFLEVVPSAVSDTFKSLGLYSQLPQWPFVVPLLVISLLFLVFAHNSDIYIDHYLQLDGALHESDGEEAIEFNEALNFNSSVAIASVGGFGEPVGRLGSLMLRPSFQPANTQMTVGPTTRRGAHTLTDAPLRRSERLQNQSTPDLE